jgi:tagatose 1,6-diphosphate aldolase
MQNLTDGEIVLKLVEDVSARPDEAWLRALHYQILLADSQVVVGHIDLRIGYTTDIVRYGGHVGYRVKGAHRGNHYAGKACKLLFVVAQQFGMDVIWITCNPDNWASRKTCEWIGAELVEIIDLPPENDMYQDGERQKCRYRIVVY